MKRIFGLFLTLCMVVGSMTCTTNAVRLDQAEYAIQSVLAGEEQTHITIQNAGACTLYLAAYDPDGRMVGVHAADVAAASDSQTIRCPRRKTFRTTMI